MKGRSYTYEEIVSLCRSGAYPSCTARAASGRLNHLLGLDRLRLKTLKQEARAHDVGLIVLGSRVSGPRLRQRSLHPALPACLPLKTTRREASSVYPGAQGVEIDKTCIKDFGVDDPRSSDLSLIVVDPRRSERQLEALAASLERQLSSKNWGFPVRVFARLQGKVFRSEEDFLRLNGAYLRGLAPERLSLDQAREGLRELYLPLNLPRRLLNAGDLRNGFLTALLLSTSIGLAMGWHASVLPVGFTFGLFGRYLARLRASVAFGLGDGGLGNAVAMAVDAAIGVGVMAALINPLAGLGLSLNRIIATSISHTLARGALRLFLDKRFSTSDEKRQSHGVMATTSLNFLQGLVTSFVYAGAPWAMALQICFMGLGLSLIFGPALTRRPPSRCFPNS